MIKYLNITLLFIYLSVRAAEFPEQRRSENDVIPRPVDGEIVETNPPAFAWLPVSDADYYQISLIVNGSPIQTIKTIFNVYIGQTVLQPGEYEWTVAAFSRNDNLLAKRRAYRFTLPADAVAFPYPDLKLLINNIPENHPRLIFKQSELPEIRATLTTTRKQAWNAVKKLADNSLNMGLPQPPGYSNIDDYAGRRLEYRKYYHYIRPYIDEGLQALAIAWMMTGDAKYADAAKQVLLHISKWPADGNTSSNIIGFDEPGLSLARCMHRAYDWLYDALTPEEREIVKLACINRARDTYQRVVSNRPFLQRPGSSHDARLIGYLCEQALVLYKEIPDKDFIEWLDYSLTSYYTVFPHWGGRDGGWAEGIGYAAAYNVRATTWIESCYSTLGLDLWRKPFFNKIQDYFLYCARPNDEMWPFGDGAERGPRVQASRAELMAELMRHYANRFNNPACQWWVDQIPLSADEISNPVTAMILPHSVQGLAPAGRENAKVFRDIGWCALHSDISDVDNDVFLLFKSSPYGSISHSHADQNSFYISVGGKSLAIPSGYYGPVYGMPHHADWTRSSKANNTILVGGMGQSPRKFMAKGEITQFQNNEKIAYVCGDATDAYMGQLNEFKRHIVFVRPGLFIILDELASPESTEFQWNMHSFEKMHLNADEQSLESGHLGAALSVKLFSSGPEKFKFEQTDLFDTPYNAGVDSAYHENVANHWHFYATTAAGQKEIRIAAILVAENSEKLAPIEYLNRDGWTGGKIKYADGTAEVWAQLDKNTGLPEFLKTKGVPEKAIVAGLWRDKNNVIINMVTNP